VFSHDCDGNDHGVCRADTARAHTLWWHLVALHEATNTLHRVMCLAPYLLGSMVIAIAVDSITFYYIVLDDLIYYSSSLTIKLNCFNLALPQPLVPIGFVLDRV